MRCLPTPLAGVLLLLGSVGKASEPVVPRVELCSSAALHEDRISLADLLPAAAPAELRRHSQHIDLGRTPQPGNLRVISRAQLEHCVAEAPGVQAALRFPEKVLVKRSGRLLSATEIVRAIRRAPELFPTLKDDALLEKNMQMQAPIFVTMDDPGLKLLGIEFDRLRQQTRFRLWTAREPRLLPFYASLSWQVAPSVSLQKNYAHLDGTERTTSEAGNAHTKNRQNAAADSTQSAGQKRGDPPADRVRELKRTKTIKPAVLTQPGRMSTLVAEGHGLRLTTRVVPLQRGVRGQQILVRSLDRQRVFTAEVVATDFLRADF